MYVFINPMKKSEAGDDLPAEITWEFAQKEIAQVKGFATGSAGLTKGWFIYYLGICSELGNCS